MIDDELMKKFDSIEDLPISEEMLGAYLENNLHGSEFREIKNLIEDDATISDLVGIVEDDMDFVKELNFSFENGVMDSFDCVEMFDDFSLPEISTLDSHSLIDSTSPLTEDIIIDGDCHNFIEDEGHFLHSNDNGQDHLNHHDPELDAGSFDNY